MNELLGASWKTSLGGLAVIALALAEGLAAVWHGQPINWVDVGAHITAGAALMNARDNKVTSEQAGASNKTPTQ